MQTGTVKFFNEAKGFGFITPTNGGSDMYFQGSSVVDGPVRENDSVEYEIKDGKKGPEAANVKKA